MDHDPNIFSDIGLAELVIFLTIWLIYDLILGFVAFRVAPYDRRAQFFLLTFFLLGPLGLAAAAIAQPRNPEFYSMSNQRAIAAGRRRFECPRCGAENDINASAESYDCWRCSESRRVKPAKTVAKQAPAVAVAKRAATKVASEIDAKVADFDAGRITLPELESFLNGLEGKRDARGKLPPS